MKHFFHNVWYNRSIARFGLLPLSVAFSLITRIRKHRLVNKCQGLPKPVVVVGNITVGGTGKTPLLIALVQHLQAMGISAGVISRGYKGKAIYPYTVDSQSQASACGDEPLLIYKRCQCPVVVSPDRYAAAQQLLADFDVDIILSDDGMQHYRLPRQMEIAVIDSKRGFGNGCLLPAGPLREPVERLDTVDLIVANGNELLALDQACYTMHLLADDLQRLGATTGMPDANGKVHAVAAIGNPDRFFKTLTDMAFRLIRHPFPDHYDYQQQDVLFEDSLPVIMTEKDAVKCQSFEGLNQHWYLPVTAQLSNDFWRLFDEKINRMIKPQQSLSRNDD